jgi:hypothetical protein
MRLRVVLSTLSALCVVASAALVAGTGSPAAAAAMPSCPAGYRATDVQCNQYSAPGPLGGISLIGDSLLLGSADGLSNPGLPRLLSDAGWGPVNYLAGKGYTTGRNLGGNKVSTAAYWITRWRSEGWDPSTIVVNLGNNDEAFCPPVVSCMKQTIDYLLDVIGPNVEVWWPMITNLDFARGPAWNQALQQAAAERPNLTVWDWPSYLGSADPPIVMDKYLVHPVSGVQYVRRSTAMAADITTRIGPSRRTGPDAALPTASGTPSDYLPVPISRIATGVHLGPGETLTFDVSATAPADATAVALTLESENPTGPGYFTAYPCGGARPMTSSLNFVTGQRRAAQALATLSATKTVCIFSYDAADIDIDVQGWFVSSNATKFTPAVPTRLLDTRETGRNATNVIAAPPGATAVALSMVGLNAASAGSLTAWSCDSPQPSLAQIYFGPGEIIAGAAYVLVSAQGTVCVSTSVAADVVVDLTGSFSPGGRLRYTPAVVQRLLDTREGLGGWTGRVGTSQSIDLQPAPPGAEAVSGTLTMVQPTVSGWLRATPCGDTQQLSSSVNAPAGAILANSLTVGLSADQQLCITSYRRSDALFDVSGWWAP